MVIRKERGQFVVRSKSGRKLGTHKTRAGAKAQLKAIEISKKRKK